MRSAPLAIALLLLFLLSSAPLWAEQRLSAVAEWRRASYRDSQGGRALNNSSHFSQQYSLLYQNQGLLMDGRSGGYALALGADWTLLDSRFNGAQHEVDAFKFLYRGEVLLAPGGLPLRLRLYSEDMTPNMLSSGGERGSMQEGLVGGGGRLLSPEILSGVYNGHRILTGATLVVGISNGSYLGEYRDVMASLPRLLVDYKQFDVRDLQGKNPQHYRDRSLAFVSLNKKSNWFHYRHWDYTDFFNHHNDTVEKTYMLGTVDHNLQRQWVNFTNWIQVSVDGSFTTFTRPNGGDNPERRYDMNFFTNARRSQWQGSTAANYRRRHNNVQLDRSLSVPFFLSGNLDRNTAWRLRLVAAKDDKTRAGSTSKREEERLFFSGQMEVFRQGRYVVVPQLEAEVKEGSGAQGYGVRIGVETYNNKRYASKYSLFGSLSLLHMDGTTSDGREVSFLEEQGIARVNADFGGGLRTGLEERVVLSQGDIDSNIGSYLSPVGNSSLSTSNAKDQSYSGNILRSTTTWFGEYATKRRLVNRLELIYDYRSTGVGTASQTVLRHSLQGSYKALRARMSNEMIWGDEQEPTDTKLQLLSNSNSGDRGKLRGTYQHKSSLNYLPRREMEGRLSFDYSLSDYSRQSSDRWRASEEFSYSIFTVNGFIRKLATLGEELAYESTESSLGESLSALTLTLFGEYYPVRPALLKAKATYRLFGSDDIEELAVFLTAGYTMQKLALSLDYSYAQRNDTDLHPERSEHRWEVKVRKTF